MPEQQQIFAGSVEDAPKDYTVSANVELRLVTVNASFTDNGAGGDWLPAVVLISDSGHVIARAVDQAVKVTAGDDAEVSWFPGVKHAASSVTPVATTTAWTQGVRSSNAGDPAYSVPATTSIAHPFPTVHVSDASVFEWITVIDPNDQLTLKKTGTYSLIGTSQWFNANFFRYGKVDMPTIDLGVHGDTGANSFVTGTDASGSPVWTVDDRLLALDSAPQTLFFRVFNGGGAAHSVANAYLGVIYHGPY